LYFVEPALHVQERLDGLYSPQLGQRAPSMYGRGPDILGRFVALRPSPGDLEECWYVSSLESEIGNEVWIPDSPPCRFTRVALLTESADRNFI
jgi:hypothetical protein